MSQDPHVIAYRNLREALTLKFKSLDEKTSLFNLHRRQASENLAKFVDELSSAFTQLISERVASLAFHLPSAAKSAEAKPDIVKEWSVFTTALREISRASRDKPAVRFEKLISNLDCVWEVLLKTEIDGEKFQANALQRLELTVKNSIN